MSRLGEPTYELIGQSGGTLWVPPPKSVGMAAQRHVHIQIAAHDFQAA